MKAALKAILVIVWMPLWLSTVVAEEREAVDPEVQAELERQLAFRAGFQEILTDLNVGSFERFTKAIDSKDMLDRIFGLRLIDQKLKRTFREDFDDRLGGMVENAFSASKGNIRAVWLGIGSKGERGRAVVRYDLPKSQFTYHVYELRLDKRQRVVIVDWTDYRRGESFSDAWGETLVAAAPKDIAVRKLVDFQNISEQEIFKMTELLKAARDGKAERYLEIHEGLGERLQRQRIVIVTTVHLAFAVRNRRLYQTALVEVDKYDSENELYALMLLDIYIPSRRYEEALQRLLKLEKRLGVQDAAMKARLSAITLVMENVEDAVAYANRAVELEPGLELGWWSALRARTVSSDFEGAMEALDMLEKQFGHDSDIEAFRKDPVLATLVASEAFQSRVETRP